MRVVAAIGLVLTGIIGTIVYLAFTTEPTPLTYEQPAACAPLPPIFGSEGQPAGQGDVAAKEKHITQARAEALAEQVREYKVKQAAQAECERRRTAVREYGDLEAQRRMADGTAQLAHWSRATYFGAVLIGFLDALLIALTLGVASWAGWHAKRAADAAQASVDGIIESAEAAKKAADAADLTSKAARGVEIPFLRIVSVSPYYSDRSDVRKWAKSFRPDLEVKNFGRTPAFITSIHTGLHFGRGAPKVVPKMTIESLPRMIAIEGGAVVTINAWAVSEGGYITNENVEMIATDPDEWLYVFGRIEFTDFLGDSHSQGFIYLWSPETRRFILPDGYEQYTIQT